VKVREDGHLLQVPRCSWRAGVLALLAEAAAGPNDLKLSRRVHHSTDLGQFTSALHVKLGWHDWYIWQTSANWRYLSCRGNGALVRTAYHLAGSWRNVCYECDTSQMNDKCLNVYGVVALTRLAYTGSLSGQHRFVTSCQLVYHTQLGWLTDPPTTALSQGVEANKLPAQCTFIGPIVRTGDRVNPVYCLSYNTRSQLYIWR